MAPKKGTKMSLSSFLEDERLGSWADEMESLPTAPAPRSEEERSRGEFGRRDFLSTRPDRGPSAPREDVPLPTEPPYTAFIGNLAFDLTEEELGAFFGPHVTKSIKIIKDQTGRPKGFGYVEFEDIEGLKDALTKSGSSFSSRTIRVNIAEPPKERSGPGGGFDDEKFSGNWRRDGPLPQSDGGSSGRRKYDGLSSGMSQDGPAPASDTVSDWRSSSRTTRVLSEPDHGPRRKGSGFSTPEGQASPADTEDTWVKGAKFKPSHGASESLSGGRFGSLRAKGDMGPPAEEGGDWRSSARPRTAGGRSSTSPSNSQPPTPQLSRRKLELLPRSTSVSATQSPLGSPKSATSPSASTPRSNPFGAARPVDVTARENAVAEKIEKEREAVKDRASSRPHHSHSSSQSQSHSMSRQSSRQARERPPQQRNGDSRPETGSQTPPDAPSVTTTPTPDTSKGPSVTATSTVRPAVSFANAAASKKDGATAAPISPPATAPAVTVSEAPADKAMNGDAIEEIVERVGDIGIVA